MDSHNIKDEGIGKSTYSLLIKLHRPQDSEIIKEKLETEYEVVDPEAYDASEVDLCIVDRRSWKDSRDEFNTIRNRQSPLLVPILMVVSATEFKQLSTDILENIEHLLTKPIQTRRLKSRLRSLSRLRERSVRSQQRQQKLELQSSVIESSVDGIAISNREGRFIHVNQSFVRIFGYENKDELRGESWRELYEGEELERFEGKVMPQFAEEGEWRGEAIGIQRDGSRIEHELSLTQVNDRHFVFIARDITERKQMQRWLNKELNWFNQLFSNDPSAIAITDPEGFILRVNPTFESLFGYSEDHIKGEEIGSLLTNSDAELDKHKRQIDVVRQEGTLQEEAVRYDSEHHPISVLLGGARVREEGETTALFHIFSDISKQKEAEQRNRELLKRERKLRTQAIESRERFKEMFESAPVALAMLEGKELRYTYANKAYQDMFEGKDMLEKPLVEVFPEAEEQGYAELLREVLHSGEAYRAEEREVWYWREDQEEYKHMYRNFEYKPLLDSKGNAYGILISAVDVTDQVEYKEKVKKRLQEKTTLLEEIHHRVKNNLAIISGLLFMQTEQTEHPEVRDKLKNSQNRIQSMALVHEQLYREAEWDAEINMSAYLPELLDTIQQTNEPETKDITVNVYSDDAFIPLTIAIPMGLLTTEVVTNAYKHAFGDREEGNIQIRLLKKEDEIELQIEDDGIGLPEDFEIEKGNLGMQIIQNLVAQIEGKLDVETEREVGTTFKVHIPI